MPAIGVKIQGLDEVRRSLAGFRDQLPYAMARSLTQVAVVVKDREVAEMMSVFDRPTPYTLGSLYIKPATKSEQNSWVWMKEFAGKGTPAYKYLYPQIYGGDRQLKRFERALQYKGVLPEGMYCVPGQGANLDSYGNMSTGQIVQILSYFQAFGEQGYRANITEKGRAKLAKGTKTKQGISYFALQQPYKNLKPGIYMRAVFNWGGAIKPIIMFVKKPHYKKRFFFFEVGQAEANEKWRPIFDAALDDAIRTAK
ncbi:MAG: hypothetical protein ABSB79_07645 [Syntrophales bacterium]|jgi:hypothetical protein